MFSRFVRSASVLRPALLTRPTIPSRLILRSSHEYVPPTQYDVPIPKRLNILYVLRVYWETIPLFLVTATSLIICVMACAWATQHKIDVVFKTHSRDNVSRTMDLRNPEIHKILIFNQRYEPWPEMQDVLDKMALAQKRSLLRAQSCPTSD